MRSAQGIEVALGAARFVRLGRAGLPRTDGQLARRPPDLEVVSGAPLGVGKNLVGLADLYEARLGAELLVAVRVVPPSQTAVRLLDLVPGGDAVDAQNLVVISHHNSSLAVVEVKGTKRRAPRDKATGPHTMAVSGHDPAKW